jgi:hypothetical protein
MQSQEAKAGMDIQGKEFDRESTIFGMEQQNYAAALEAKAKQREAGAKGLGALGAGILGGYANKEGATGLGGVLGAVGGFLGLKN